MVRYQSNIIEHVIKDTMAWMPFQRNIMCTHLYLSSLGINVESGCITLGIFTSLNGTIFSIDILRGKSYNPIDGVTEGNEEWVTVFASSPDFGEGRESIRYFVDNGNSVSMVSLNCTRDKTMRIGSVSCDVNTSKQGSDSKYFMIR